MEDGKPDILPVAGAILDHARVPVMLPRQSDADMRHDGSRVTPPLRRSGQTSPSMSPDECTAHQDPDRQRIPDRPPTPVFRSGTQRGADEDDWTESENWNYEGKIKGADVGLVVTALNALSAHGLRDAEPPSAETPPPSQCPAPAWTLRRRSVTADGGRGPVGPQALKGGFAVASWRWSAGFNRPTTLDRLRPARRGLGMRLTAPLCGAPRVARASVSGAWRRQTARGPLRSPDSAFAPDRARRWRRRAEPDFPPAV